MASHFPTSAALKSKEGAVVTVASQNFQLLRLVSEKFISSLQEHVAVFEGQRSDDGEVVVIKLRFQ
jgi:hypothetical protein